MAMLSSINNVKLLLVEIADDDVLIAAYGTRIPVLQRSDTLSEIDWPFNTTKIKSFIQ